MMESKERFVHFVFDLNPTSSCWIEFLSRNAGNLGDCVELNAEECDTCSRWCPFFSFHPAACRGLLRLGTQMRLVVLKSSR